MVLMTPQPEAESAAIDHGQVVVGVVKRRVLTPQSRAFSIGYSADSIGYSADRRPNPAPINIPSRSSWQFSLQRCFPGSVTGGAIEAAGQLAGERSATS